MSKICRYKHIDRYAFGKILAVLMALSLLAGCAKGAEATVQDAQAENGEESQVDIAKLRETNEDIFAWINVPNTSIDYPVLQSSDGDDSFYINHNVDKEADPKGAIYTECANLKNMCDFNEVLHGSAPEDGTMFADVEKFLDRKYFEEHPYIYVYMEGNALIYYVFAAYSRSNTRLLQEYDFTCASGCQAFLDEIYNSRSMTKNIRSGWEGAVAPENFIITLTTTDNTDPSKQIIVVGCLVGDVMGKIDREIDYSEPE